MISDADFTAIANLVRAAGFGEEAQWSENITPPTDASEFATEAIFVICNGGMQNRVARLIYDRVREKLAEGHSASDAFKHKRKAAAIDRIWSEREALFETYLAADDKVAACRALPHIGAITQFHLAKNFGADVAKPDVHMQRLADHEGTSVQALCERLAVASRLRIATVDVILWRACAEGILNSRTGEIA